MSPLAVRTCTVRPGLRPAGAASARARSVLVYPAAVKRSSQTPVPGATPTLTPPDADLTLMLPELAVPMRTWPEAVVARTEPPALATSRLPLAECAEISPPTWPACASPEAKSQANRPPTWPAVTVPLPVLTERSPVTCSTEVSAEPLVTVPEAYRPEQVRLAEPVLTWNRQSSGSQTSTRTRPERQNSQPVPSGASTRSRSPASQTFVSAAACRDSSLSSYAVTSTRATARGSATTVRPPPPMRTSRVMGVGQGYSYMIFLRDFCGSG